MLRVLAASVLVLAGASSAGEPVLVTSYGPAELHGRVVLDNFSTHIGVPAVTFDHWRHRVMFTCRVCHVDLEFALAAGETRVSAATNEAGQHCGACHNGKTQHRGAAVFRSCSGWPRADSSRGCTRCHAGANAPPGRGYHELARKLPLDRADYIDWVAAERDGLLDRADAVEGVSTKAPEMKIDRDLTIVAAGTWLEDVTFSHRKHSVWNGCELCHPEIFPVTKRNSVRYDMAAIRTGRFCGVCHLNVAFPIDACQRCHSDERRRPFR